MRKTSLFRVLRPVCGALLAFAIVPAAHAVPSFARQTGVSCAGCHTAFPQLNAFGRQFKMQGYTLSTAASQEAQGIGIGAPLSVMIQTTWSRQDSAPEPDADNTVALLPSQFSLFYAGRATDKVGAFVQITAEEGSGFSQDNTDIRIANTGMAGSTPVTYGATLNNNPTVQDPWNSTPVWGFPWFEAGYGYAYPHTLMTAVGGAVAGGTAYAFWNNHVYTELGSYTASNSLGKDGPGTDGGKVIKDMAPYWRLAYASDGATMNWEVGTFGMAAKVPTNGFAEAGDKFTDAGVDTQMQWALGADNSLTLDGHYIHETQTLDATAPGSDSQHLDVLKADLTWYSRQRVGFTLGYRGVTSSTDAVSFSDDLGGDGLVGASPDGQDAQAWLVQADYTPWANTRLALQYVDYTRLNGTSTGASDNNQLMLGAWLVF